MVSVRRHRLRRWVPFAVLVAGLLLAVLLMWYVARITREVDVATFERTTADARDRIEIRLNTYIELLRAGAALFAASTTVAPDEFRAFVRQLNIGGRYPGIQAIGLAEYVVDDEGVPHTPILVLEPAEENQGAIGFDMFTEPTRRAAMQRARATRQPAACGLVRLVQRNDDVPPPVGFLIYVPIFRGDSLYGFVYGAFRGDDLLRSILTEHPGYGFSVYDGGREDRAALLYEAPLPEERAPDELLRVTSRLDVAGRPWMIVFEAAQHFSGTSPWVAPGVLIAGVLLSLALFKIMRTQFLAWENTMRHAAELRASEEAQRAVGERLRRLIALEREARAEAQQADRAKDEFLATLSHELRTPLNAMLGWITMLRTGRLRDERRAEALEVIERNARTQAQLIEDLLDVSRIVAGKVRLELQPLHMAPIVHATIEEMRPVAEGKGVALRADVDDGVPTIVGDPSRIQQIVWNLLSNAIKFTPSGGRVDVTLDQDGEMVRLTVRDTGIGIDPAFLPHVFERFRQADSSSTRQHSGVGLGLAIVRHLAELHHGTVQAHSDGPQRGSTFVLRLPAAAPAAGARREEKSAGTAELTGVRALVIEDDADARVLLEEALSAAGASVTTADSADAALVALDREFPSVIVSDIAMPGVDGYELMRRVRRMPGERGAIPAIAVTAYARPSDRDRALQAGFQAHVGKPVDVDDLVRTVASLVHNAGFAAHRP